MNKIYNLLSMDAPQIKEDCGIEIEMEFKNRYPERAVEGWKKHRDDSLRGASAEYVSNPMNWDQVKNRLSVLHKSIESENVKINDSLRAGVHIHVNMLNKTLNDVGKVAQIYAILEDILLSYCGNNRISNLFCLRFLDAEFAVDSICQALKYNDIWFLDSDNLRYCSLNFRSLLVHGTIEFRSLQTPSDIREIETWTKLIQKIVEFAEKSESMFSIIEMFSMIGPRNFIEEVVGSELFNKHLSKYFNQQGAVEGMRYAQQIANYQYMGG